MKGLTRARVAAVGGGVLAAIMLYGAVPAIASVVPSISINDVNAYEHAGDVGFTARLSEPSDQAVTVDVLWIGGTAEIGSDLTVDDSALVFAPGETVAYPMFHVIDDALGEPTETFSIELRNPSNAMVEDAQGLGTILDNEEVDEPEISIADGSAGEGADNLRIVMSLSHASDFPITVDIETEDGTATANSDYEPGSGYVYFAPGVTTRTLLFRLVDDSIAEPPETFNVNLSGPSGATIADNRGVATIEDNDSSTSISIADVTVAEGAESATAVITLSRASTVQTTVNVATMNGTAGSADYEDMSGTVVFGPGTTSRSLRIDIFDDQLVETNERFSVRLSTPMNASISDGEAQVTIVDNDGAAIVYRRSFATFSLRRHLVAVGRLQADNDFTDCLSGVRVKLQRRNDQGWATIAKTSTNDDGRFRIRLRDRAGKYRAVATEFNGPGSAFVCSSANTLGVRHRH